MYLHNVGYGSLLKHWKLGHHIKWVDYSFMHTTFYGLFGSNSHMTLQVKLNYLPFNEEVRTDSNLSTWGHGPHSHPFLPY